MIAENRETSEKQQDRESCIQALEKYLRQEVDAKQLDNDAFAYAVEQRLVFKAKDWGLKYKADMIESDYNILASEAMSRFIKNWEDKKPGEDDRGHRLGKSQYLGT